VRASQRVRVALEDKGLVTRSPEQVTRYSAVPPDIAADVLIARRQGALHHARAAMVKLRDSIEGDRKDGETDERFVEILSRQTAAQMYRHLIATTNNEILGLERMPMLVSTIDEVDPRFMECLARGVRCRSITDSELLNLPGTLKRIRIGTEAGEQYRVYPSLPFKLVAFDRASRSSRCTSRSRMARCCWCAPRRCSMRCARCSRCTGARRVHSSSANRHRRRTRIHCSPIH